MGIWDIIRWPFGQLLRLSYELLGSYAIAIFLFALAIKVVMLPLSIKQVCMTGEAHLSWDRWGRRWRWPQVGGKAMRA